MDGRRLVVTARIVLVGTFASNAVVFSLGWPSSAWMTAERTPYNAAAQ